MSLLPPICTCAFRDHACSPPCKAHPELGGGLGNPGTLGEPGLSQETLRRAAMAREADVRAEVERLRKQIDEEQHIPID